MAGKEAVVFVVDVSMSMGVKAESSSKTRLEEALEGVRMMIESKILQSKTNEVGIILFGTEDTDNPLAEDMGDGNYENVTVLAPLERPAVSLTAQLEEDVKPGIVSADLIDGLVVAVDMMHRRTDKKKYIRSIYLITAAANPIDGDGDLEPICERLQAMDTDLYVIGADFVHSTKEEGSVIKEEGSVHKEEGPVVKSEVVDEDGGDALMTKRENEKMLVSIVEATSGRVIPAKDLVARFSVMHGKQVRPTKSKCVLMIGDENFDVLYFSRAKQSAAPTLKKECSSTYDPLDAKSGGTKTDRNYFCASALDDPVPPEALVKGFRYGKDYVPLSLADREAMKVPSERSELQILAFSPVALTQPEDSIGDTKCIIPVIGNARSEAVVGALAKSLLVAKRQAIVRFVGRKNGDPQLGVLRHDSSCSEYARLILTQIPFDDDIRGYNFPPVNPKLLPSAKQRAAAATVVKQLSLADDAFHLESSFSPVLQRVKQTLIARARDPKVPLPEIDARVKAYMNPSQEMMVHAKSALKSFEEKFKFTAVEKASRKRKHFWSDMADTKDDSSSAPSSSGATGDGVKGEGNGAAVAAGSDGGKQEVGSLNPVEDFDRMMKSVKLVEKALELMRERIIVFVTQGGTAAYRKKAVLCVKALREGCLRESESALFNRFMRDTVKANHETLLEEVQKAGLTLISEEEDSAVYDVTADDAMAFLSTQVKSQAASIVPQDGEDSDESLFDDLE